MKVLFIEEVKYRGEIITMESFGTFNSITEVEEFIEEWHEEQDIVRITKWYDIGLLETLTSI